MKKKQILSSAGMVGIAIATGLGNSTPVKAYELKFRIAGSFGDTVENTSFGSRPNDLFSHFSGTYSYDTKAEDLLPNSTLDGRYLLSDFDLEVYQTDGSIVAISPENNWTGTFSIDLEDEPIPLMGAYFSNANQSEALRVNFEALRDDDSLPTRAPEKYFTENPGYYRVQRNYPDLGSSDYYLVDFESTTVRAVSTPEPGSIVSLGLIGVGCLLKKKRVTRRENSQVTKHSAVRSA